MSRCRAFDFAMRGAHGRRRYGDGADRGKCDGRTDDRAASASPEGGRREAASRPCRASLAARGDLRGNRLYTLLPGRTGRASGHSLILTPSSPPVPAFVGEPVADAGIIMMRMPSTKTVLFASLVAVAAPLTACVAPGYYGAQPGIRNSSNTRRPATRSPRIRNRVTSSSNSRIRTRRRSRRSVRQPAANGSQPLTSTAISSSTATATARSTAARSRTSSRSTARSARRASPAPSSVRWSAGRQPVRPRSRPRCGHRDRCARRCGGRQPDRPADGRRARPEQATGGSTCRSATARCARSTMQSPGNLRPGDRVQINGNQLARY